MNRFLSRTLISASLVTNCVIGMDHTTLNKPEVRTHKSFIEHLKIIDTRTEKREGTLYCGGERVPNYPQKLLTEPQFEKLKQSLSHLLAPDQDMQRYITLDIARVEDPTNPMLQPNPVPTIVQKIFNLPTLTVGALCAITGYLIAKQSQSTNN